MLKLPSRFALAILVNTIAACAGPPTTQSSTAPSTSASPQPSTAGGWVKFPQNPVLGGELGTCFDVALLNDSDAFRMYFSWRPKKSIALAESKDGIHWSEPLLALQPNPNTDWEEDINRPVVVKRDDGYHLWYTGQAKGHSRIGYATSPDGKTWTRSQTSPCSHRTSRGKKLPSCAPT